jgi:hypothetical protein
MAAAFFWVLFSILLGNEGKQRKIGGATAFFCSLFFSPLIGLFVVLTSDKLQAEQPAQVGPPVSVADELLKLKSLHDAGALTAAEYDAQKARLLG